MSRDKMNATSGTFLQPYLEGWMPYLYASSFWWTLFGFTGNVLFSSRFLFQWLASERRKELFVPTHFWYLSFWGSVINLIYAFHIDNAPIILGAIALPFIYGRNLVLLHSCRNGASEQRAERAALRPRLGPA